MGESHIGLVFLPVEPQRKTLDGATCCTLYSARAVPLKFQSWWVPPLLFFCLPVETHNNYCCCFCTCFLFSSTPFPSRQGIASRQWSRIALPRQCQILYGFEYHCLTAALSPARNALSSGGRLQAAEGEKLCYGRNRSPEPYAHSPRARHSKERWRRPGEVIRNPVVRARDGQARRSAASGRWWERPQTLCPSKIGKVRANSRVDPHMEAFNRIVL